MTKETTVKSRCVQVRIEESEEVRSDRSSRRVAAVPDLSPEGEALRRGLPLTVPARLGWHVAWLLQSHRARWAPLVRLDPWAVHTGNLVGPLVAFHVRIQMYVETLGNLDNCN